MRNSTSPGMARMPSLTFRSMTTLSRGAVQVIVKRHLAGALDLVDDVRRNGEVLEPAPRALEADGRKILGRRGGNVGRVEPEQGLPLVDMAARRDVLDRLDEGFGPHRDNGDPALVLVEGAGGPHRHGQGTALDRLRRTPVRWSLPGEMVTVDPSSSPSWTGM